MITPRFQVKKIFNSDLITRETDPNASSRSDHSRLRSYIKCLTK